MATTLLPRLRISIRFKLLLVASSLLIIPWIGTQYIQEMESYLRQQQEQALLTRTQMVATVMQGRPDLFQTKTVVPLPTRAHHIFVRPLHSQIVLDGYLDDWAPYRERMQLFNLNHAIKGSEMSSLSFEHQLGTYNKYMYVVFKVTDDRIIYRDPNSLLLDKSDHLIIAMQDEQGQLRQYIITTIAPGWVNAHEVEFGNNGARSLRPEYKIKGEWQETARGYNIEFRIPLGMLHNRISFAIADVDNPVKRETDTIIATADIENKDNLGTMMFPSAEAEALLTPLQKPLTRTWVIDKNNRVIARTGALTRDDDEQAENPKRQYGVITGLMSLLYKMILKQPATEFHDELLNASRLNSMEFRQALNGHSDIRWRQTPDKEVNILTAAYPVFDGDKVVGAVAIEQTSNSILLVQNRALEILFNLSALAFVIASVVLLLFASRLSSRVRRLRDATEQAISSDGRVVGSIAVSATRDEIGDLSRGVADMLERLAQYNRYLESMASKLSHELRTPITVVRSSLENMNEHSKPQDIATYTQRAREGIDRLNNILTRMSEATRLEQTLQSEIAQRFDLREVVRGCVEGYKLAHENIRFNLVVDRELTYPVIGTPDLIAQMLDKLISNAIDFHHTNTPIEIMLTRQAKTLQLIVSNSGPLLPSSMQANLFESMVSVREQKGDQSHLGLGLYIVRLIADFHHAQVQARNRQDKSGVEFVISLPLATS